MSSQRQKRRQKQMAEETPQNMTCGGCKKVVVANDDLICSECGYGERGKKKDGGI